MLFSLSLWLPTAQITNSTWNKTLGRKKKSRLEIARKQHFHVQRPKLTAGWTPHFPHGSPIGSCMVPWCLPHQDDHQQPCSSAWCCPEHLTGGTCAGAAGGPKGSSHRPALPAGITRQGVRKWACKKAFSALLLSSKGLFSLWVWTL